MNELDLVRGFRAQLGGPDPQTVARVRTALLTHPAGAVDSPGRHRPGSGRRRTLLRAAVAVAASLALVVGATSGVFRGPRANSAVAAALDQRFGAGPTLPGPGPLTAGRYWYTKTEVTTMVVIPIRSERWLLHRLNSEVEQRWIGRDGSGRLSVVVGDPVHVSAGERAKWAAVRGTADYVGDVAQLDPDRRREAKPGGEPTVFDDHVGPHSFDFGALGRSYEDLLRLPADPDVLYQRLAEAAQARVNGDDLDGLADLLSRIVHWLNPQFFHQYMFDIAGEAAAAPAADPRLVAALYRAAARIPGVELIERTTDQIGRPGMALSLLGTDGVRHELIFDPATATPLGQRWVVARRSPDLDADPGTVVGLRTYLAAGMVGSTSATVDP